MLIDYAEVFCQFFNRRWIPRRKGGLYLLHYLYFFLFVICILYSIKSQVLVFLHS